MVTDESRRQLLRFLGLGGAGALAGGTGGALLARYPGIQAKATDMEQIRASVMVAKSFELETAWLHETPAETRTLPEQTEGDFPDDFAPEAGPKLRFDDVEPGSSGRLLGAYTLKGASGRVLCAGLRAGSPALAEVIELTCTELSDFDGSGGGSGQVIFKGPLGKFPTEPFGSPECMEPDTVGGFELAYRVPDIEDEEVLEAIESQSLDFAFQLVAKQC